jgi:hypothetical protein
LWDFERDGRFHERLGIRWFKRFAAQGDYWNRRRRRSELQQGTNLANQIIDAKDAESLMWPNSSLASEWRHGAKGQRV